MKYYIIVEAEGTIKKYELETLEQLGSFFEKIYEKFKLYQRGIENNAYRTVTKWDDGTLVGAPKLKVTTDIRHK